MLVLHGSGDTVTQIAFAYNNSSLVKVRSGNPLSSGGKWYDWVQLGTNALATATANGLISKDNHILIDLLRRVSDYAVTKEPGVHYGKPTVFVDEKTALVEWLSADKETGSNGYEEGVASFEIEEATEAKAGLMTADDKQALNNLFKGYEYYIKIMCPTNNWRDVLNGIGTLRDFGSRLSINGVNFKDNGFEALFGEFISRIKPVGWNNVMSNYGFLNAIVIDVYSADSEHFILRYSGTDSDDWIYFTTSRSNMSGKMSGVALLYDGDDSDLAIFAIS